MPQGFFASAAKPAPKIVGLVPACGACGLHKTCDSPKMPVTGEGKHGVLIVAEAPGGDEDEQGIQLIGKAGQRLRQSIAALGYDLDRDCWKTNALICRPSTKTEDGKRNRTPTKDEIGYCRPNLIQTIKELKPRMIIPLGGPAVESVIGHLWKEDVGGISRWVGFQIPCQKPNVWICPTHHPSYLLREEDGVLDMWFERHLELAFDLVGRPWTEKQDWVGDVRVVVDDDEAAQILYGISLMEDGALAIDFETTTLKPDTPWSEIVCCAVSWGRTKPEITVAYPWRGKAREATQAVTRSPIPKIASNLKFEDRWVRKEFGHRVRNWCHDTMLFAHLMDSRPGITGLKFQSFAHLGFPEYSDHISPYLDGGSARGKNRVNEVDKSELLRYCGLDALLEFRLAVRQRQIMGFDIPWSYK